MVVILVYHRDVDCLTPLLASCNDFFRKLTKTEMSLIRTEHNSILACCERFYQPYFNYFNKFLF